LSLGRVRVRAKDEDIHISQLRVRAKDEDTRISQLRVRAKDQDTRISITMHFLYRKERFAHVKLLLAGFEERCGIFW